MKIGVLGSGPVGQQLGEAFVKSNHEVMIGSRDPSKLNSWVTKQPAGKASSGTFADTAAFGQIVLVATLWQGTKAVLEAVGRNLDGKVIIDVTNPLDFSGNKPRLALGYGDSGGETVQRLIPNARVVKAFNIVGNAHMYKPDFDGGPPTMFICGNDEEAKREVTKILDNFGWETIDIGGIDGSRLLEPLAMLWVAYYLKVGTGDHAFKLLRRSA